MKYSFSAYSYSALAIALVSSVLIFFSSQRQSFTMDEANHINCGLEWIQHNTYKMWPENPPLARALVGFGANMKGYKLPVPVYNKDVTFMDLFFKSFDHDYYSKGDIYKAILLSRILILPVFLLSVFIVWMWAKKLAGKPTAFLAVGIYATLPPIMAHSGLATTDVAFLTSFLLLMWIFVKWLKKPSPLMGVCFGGGLALAILTKFSIFLFFPAASLLFLTLFLKKGRKELGFTFKEWGLRAIKSLGIAFIVCCLVIWAVYGFSYGSVKDEPTVQAILNNPMFPAEMAKYFNISLPAPSFFVGILLVTLHNIYGQWAYFGGELSMTGFWYFYPLALLIKTPLPYLLHLFVGIIAIWIKLKRNYNWEIMALSLLPFAILLAIMPGNLNLGIRHVIALYPFGAIAGAFGICSLLAQMDLLSIFWKKLIPAGLVTAQLAIALASYPNYLSYFNLFVGDEPGEYLVDSDLDWGQGLIELSEFCKENKVDTLNLALFGYTRKGWYGLTNIKPLPSDTVVHGWVAVSEFLYRGLAVGMVYKDGRDSTLSFTWRPEFKDDSTLHRKYRWLDKHPLAGKASGAIRIYHIP